ncbi:DUF4920 domain-containing protein [Pararhodonellum marinum]|uniref:DUF4920 domain-containing protein n=1 Tax=Pararhodonellum marinum TaxID=2755358 RepID=UPI0018906580|nr:DUF4920 domain-containing protein [Pararhodonellum marinum]
MKKLGFLLLMLTFAIVACQKSVQDENSNNEETITGTFGEEVKENQLVSLDQVYDHLKENDQFEGQIVGEIKEVCAKKGCWMTMELPNGQSMRVTFKDYGFFVPKQSAGYPVIIEGVATKKVTDVETLRHFAEDEGKSAEEVAAITEAKEEMVFEARGVIIKEKA